MAGTTDTLGFTGDEGPATNATLDFPTDVAVQPDGGFLIVDNNNRRIRRVAPDGTIDTAAGTGAFGFGGDGGPATDAVITPLAIASTPDGGYLLADTATHRIRRVSVAHRHRPPAARSGGE